MSSNRNNKLDTSSNGEDRVRQNHYRRLVEDYVEVHGGDCSKIDHNRVEQGWFSNLPAAVTGEYEVQMQRAAQQVELITA